MLRGKIVVHAHDVNSENDPTLGNFRDLASPHPDNIPQYLHALGGRFKGVTYVHQVMYTCA